MERLTFKKPRLHFDTASHPTHVTFDDGQKVRRNLPWARYVEARWRYADRSNIEIEIGEWSIVLTGHNLEPLFAAIEEHTLLRVCAHPSWSSDRERESDCFVTGIRFSNALGVGMPPARSASPQLDLELTQDC